MKLKEKNFISIVVYLRNAEKTIGDFLHKIDEFIKDKFDSYEFILVNDASEDNTLDEIKKVTDKLNGNTTVINLAWKHKLELGMLAGVDLAIGDFVYEIESTAIDYDIQVLWEAYQKSLSGFDIVAVSPDKPLKLTSKMFYHYLNKVSYRRLELSTESFRLVSRRALNRILRSKEKIRYRKALYSYAGFLNTTIKYKPISTSVSVNNDTSFTEKIELATDILVSYSNFGLRISLSLSLLFLFISIAVGMYTVYIYLTLKQVVTGWTTTMLFLSISFTGIFFVLAFLSKYMTAILFELQDRPRYTYKSVDKLSKK